ncbi:MAG TPA: hypothetical protein VHD85_19515 [Terracidiphilus sp.]|nr:hypothetical protein [Terracidiphilus sp.]
MVSFPVKFKKEMVLWFKYKRANAAWKRVTERPGVLRLTNHDCSEEYREPILLGNLADGFVEVRVYDEQGIDIANESTLLGNWEQARVRCDQFMQCQSQTMSGER